MAIQRIYLWHPAPRCNSPCPDANFDTLELQLCDNIDIPDCETEFTVNGPENYFSVTIQDIDFGKSKSDSICRMDMSSIEGYYGTGYLHLQ